MKMTIAKPASGFNKTGLYSDQKIHFQLPACELIQHTLKRGEGVLSDTGALVIHTGEFTGRSPKDKYLVLDDITQDRVNWNDFNLPIAPEYFNAVHKSVNEYMEGLPELYIRDCFACADPRYRLGIRVMCEKPAGNLFAYNMFIRPKKHELENFQPDWHVFCAPDLKLDPTICGTRQQNAAIISFREKLILIAGTGYTGEIKKGIFTVLNFILPYQRNVLSMHCSANIGKRGDTALFFGLSGTGKTTLSADPERKLIGDDEHGWTKDNIFNFEGGCYAKTIDLSEEKEPEIFQAIREGALLENTSFYPGTNRVDYSNKQITENTRVSYPLNYIRNSQEPSVGNVPRNIFFLTCDAYGVLPPISRLTPEQAMYQFISGYTAKVAGTEAGVNEPKSTFSACFGAPFIPLHPGRYAEMLGEKLREEKVTVWLVNTGWTGGPYGEGSRIKLSYTRAMIKAALNGDLNHVQYIVHPIFKFNMPVDCPGIPASLLDPEKTWINTEKYLSAAKALAQQFISNFKKYESAVSEEINCAAPTM
jgi:phosphoenolpyruvate carboxykinase (ATP)